MSEENKNHANNIYITEIFAAQTDGGAIFYICVTFWH